MSDSEESPVNSPKVFYGEGRCQAKHASGKHEGLQCTNKTYYKCKNLYVCGVHSGGNRTKLPNNPDAKFIKEKKLSEHQKTVDKAQERNMKNGQHGKVACSKMGMRRSLDDMPDFLYVFPNFRHQGRKDGFGCASLSPMNLGPVKHKQKELPDAKLLENYHQYNKVFNTEIDKNNQPSKNFHNLQIKGYKSNTGTRHKITGKVKNPKTGALERPRTLYSIHKDDAGKEQKYDYVKSRYFYCHFYEKLVEGNKDLQKIEEMKKNGINLRIIGYDGYHVTRDLMFHYTDPSRPFGHELVLYTLLTVDDPKQYPWNKYYEMHKDLYPESLKPDYLASGNRAPKMDTGDIPKEMSKTMDSESNSDEDLSSKSI